MEAKIFKVLFDENDQTEGVQAISLVEFPAMESNWVTLSKESKAVKLADVSKERRIVLGAVLIPDKPIERQENGETFFIEFPSETIQKAVELYAKNSRQNNATVEHQSAINSTTVVETWIKEDEGKDKSVMYGFSDPVGTWYAMMKIHDEQMWNDYVKTGMVKGFSIEGFFSREEITKMSKLPEQNLTDEQKLEEIKKLLNA